MEKGLLLGPVLYEAITFLVGLRCSLKDYVKGIILIRFFEVFLKFDYSPIIEEVIKLS